MICRISVYEKKAICRPKYKYKYISVDFFLANLIFFGPIQIQIYLVVPKIGQCEYKYDYSDWYLKEKNMNMNLFNTRLNICLQ